MNVHQPGENDGNRKGKEGEKNIYLYTKQKKITIRLLVGTIRLVIISINLIICLVFIYLFV